MKLCEQYVTISSKGIRTSKFYVFPCVLVNGKVGFKVCLVLTEICMYVCILQFKCFYFAITNKRAKLKLKWEIDRPSPLTQGMKMKHPQCPRFHSQHLLIKVLRWTAWCDPGELPPAWPRWTSDLNWYKAGSCVHSLVAEHILSMQKIPDSIPGISSLKVLGWIGFQRVPRQQLYSLNKQYWLGWTNNLMQYKAISYVHLSALTEVDMHQWCPVHVCIGEKRKADNTPAIAWKIENSLYQTQNPGRE